MRMRYELELAPSSQAVCRCCSELIKKGTLRIKKKVGISYGREQHRYFCRECAKDELHEEVMQIEKLLIRMRKWK